MRFIQYANGTIFSLMKSISVRSPFPRLLESYKQVEEMFEAICDGWTKSLSSFVNVSTRSQGSVYSTFSRPI